VSTPEHPVDGPPPVPQAAVQSSAGLRRPIAALVAGVAIVAAYLVLGFLQVFAAVVYDWASSRFEEGFGRIASSSLPALSQEGPVAVVLLVVSFLFFWGALPLHQGLRFGQAVGRGVVAAIVAGLVTGVVVSIQYLAIVRNLSSGAGQVLGANSVLRSLAEAANNSVSYFVQTAPLIVLASVILWNWTRSHPLTSDPQVVGPDARVPV
jgi:hypothetical protein